MENIESWEEENYRETRVGDDLYQEIEIMSPEELNQLI